MRSEELSARLKALAMMLKYGHDLFDAKSFSDAATLVVNNSQRLLNFRTSTLLEIAGGKAHVIGQYGQVEPNIHSRLAVVQCRFAESLKLDSEPKIVTAADGLPEELAVHDAVYCCLKLRPPANLDHMEIEFIWLLEYENEVPAYVPNTFKLLATSASSALYYQRLCKSQLWIVKRHMKKRWLFGVILLLLAGIMFVRVPESVTAEFTLKAPDITATYALFDGSIAACYRQDGETVNRGDLIAEYSTDQLSYRLASAQDSLREIEAELALEQQNAFTNEERLGMVKLLEARRDTMLVAVKEAQWYLDQAKIKAPADGIIALTDGRAEQLVNKAVRTGDKLFEVLGGSGMAAEIPVNEREASILNGEFSAVLFLYTSPEEAIPAEIQEVSHYPQLTEQKTYCYMVRVRLPENLPDLRYGMRGIARLSGEKTFLGYRLFKSLVLYFRGL